MSHPNATFRELRVDSLIGGLINTRTPRLGPSEQRPLVRTDVCHARLAAQSAEGCRVAALVLALLQVDFVLSLLCSSGLQEVLE